ncbi:MAG: toprim domain-containing protein [Polaromonas sp.]|nr:toprim domain-containing protein [Polaromonas sp.]
MNFRDTLIASGFHPRDIVPDGRWHRCATEDHPKKRNGAYKLALDGCIGWWRNWATDSEPNTWTDGSNTKAKPIDPAILRARREQEREETLKAVRYARDLWAGARPYAPHDYLARKGLSVLGCDHLRVWRGEVWVDEVRVLDDWLLVPMFWRGALVNVQRISTAGVKRQIARAPQIGASLELSRPNAAVTVVVEGLATGLAVFQSIRLARVIVAFYADNLAPVIDELRPTGSVVIAADNDWGTAAKGKGNPGIDKARNAAELIDCGVAYPEHIEGTDWCDALKEWGERAPARIQRLILRGARAVRSTKPAPRAEAVP